MESVTDAVPSAEPPTDFPNGLEARWPAPYARIGVTEDSAFLALRQLASNLAISDEDWTPEVGGSGGFGGSRTDLIEQLTGFVVEGIVAHSHDWVQPLGAPAPVLSIELPVASNLIDVARSVFHAQNALDELLDELLAQVRITPESASAARAHVRPALESALTEEAARRRVKFEETYGPVSEG